MEKIRVGLFFGSISSEHEVSCTSAAAWVRALQKGICAERYALTLVGITKAGRWLYYNGPADALPDGSWQHHESCRPCILSPDRQDHGLLLRDGEATRLLPLDVAVPILHGKNGEDGTIQGLFSLAGIPYVGCGVLASATCMDKAVANTLMDAAGVPHCGWCWATRDEAADFAALARRVEAALPYPIFVKPANAGSSVGISKAKDRTGLQTAVEIALAEDDKVVFEEFIDGQEVECAAIGNTAADITATRPGEILAGAEFYTYDDKYKNGVSQVVIPARLSEAKLEEVRATAIRAYRTLGCTGLARCDFFVERGTGRVLCNELNTLPGFTDISMYPKLMAHDGVDFTTLADRLITLARNKRKGAY
ncbi:MAG: D-alanine--D-alanine ligase [Gemmiger sp.]|nr:D-alanine--D-alanine ligase [Gemmiger sp.]